MKKPRTILALLLILVLLFAIAVLLFGPGTEANQPISVIIGVIIGALASWLGRDDKDEEVGAEATQPGWPVPSKYKITTPYGRRGSYWSCDKVNGKGIHTGADFACPVGTPVYATIAGQVRHRNYGSAFGNHQVAISPDSDQPFGDGEVFYAHMRKRAANGTRVKVGDWIGEVGIEGNVSGAHLHYEYHPNAKGKWSCAVVADPSPTLGGGGSGGGSYVTTNIYSDRLGYGEPTNGDDSSDTVRELQERLNRISLPDGKTIEVTGRYDDDTDAEVRKWQLKIGNTPDPPQQSYLGSAQMKAMFPESVYTLHDRGLPAIADGPVTPPEPPEPPDPTEPPEPPDPTEPPDWPEGDIYKVRIEGPDGETIYTYWPVVD